MRIGLHWGSVLTDGTLVTADSVHLARASRALPSPRRVPHAPGLPRFGPELRLHCHPIGTRELKELTQPFDLLELDWRDPAAFPRRC